MIDENPGTLEQDDEKRRRLIRLIRRLAKEEAYAVLDEHLEEYEHEERKPENWET